MSLHKLLYILISLLYPLSSFVLLTQQNSELRSYIIHVKKLDDDKFNNTHTITTNYHKSFLPDTSTSNDSFLYSYKHVISGFAARLTSEEVEVMKKKDGFILAHPERTYQLLTTRSPSFLGLRSRTGLWNQSKEGMGVIIGVVDSGIFPSHPSFSDEKMSPPLAKWKGRCEFPNKTYQCNNKIVGARFFYQGSDANEFSPLDQSGHGTHTASTAAGEFVKNACYLGLACGTAVGMAPRAHLAIYKVCDKTELCLATDILAGIDSAIEDGVDVLSISIGSSARTFYDDIVAIGALAAVRKGIFVSFPSGNNGPFKKTVINDAPWVLTVGASTIDRRLVATAKLGNGQEFDGESLYQSPKEFGKILLPLVYGASCRNTSLFDVKGKVVLCDGFLHNEDFFVKNAGGAAVILANLEEDGFSIDVELDRFLPTAHVSYMAGQKIKAYINSTKSPTATILFKGTVIGDPLDPIVASFSSRGPSLQTPGVLKPDIIGPGMNILAASPFHFGANKDSKVTFDIWSGTSMSTPHLAGVAALLKSAHPNWTPAAIKSAIMTTADLVNAQRTTLILDGYQLTPADVFATGAGHVNPSKAVDPGLVYNIEPDDYIPFLCGLGYNDEQVGKIAQKSVKCTSKIPQEQLNYPTFSILLGSSPQTFQRTVTNVGDNYSYYIAMVFPPKGVKIVVRPRQLWFRRVDQKATYYVTFSRCGRNITNTDSQGYLLWVSRKHTVASVVSVNFTIGA